MAYLPLSTANLPDPAIDPAQGSSPQDYFNTVTYTGNSLNPASVTGVGFQPDFVWVKTRSFGNTNHRLQDVVRGSNKRLMSDLTNAEIDTAGGIQSFDSDGFTVGDGTSKDGFIHFGGRTFVAWNWKANGSGVSNTDGSITSTVSANTESGFSIVSYTGDGTTSHNVGHGLGSKPDMIIVKTRNTGSTRWIVAHKDIPTTNRLVLDDTFASAADGDRISAYDATTFTHNWNGANSNTFIAYCFHSVEGFSKFGSYTGNGNADGPFVYTGFRPAFVLVKSSSSAGEWWIYDTQRDTSNQMVRVLRPRTSDAENTSYALYLDCLSNGFKIRTSAAGTNGSGTTHIYMAFAENPFKYSNAR